MTDSTDDGRPDGVPPRLSRRDALAAGSLSALAALAGCSSLEGLLNGDSGGQTRAPPTTPEDGAPEDESEQVPWEVERSAAGAVYEAGAMSFEPSYDHEAVSVEADTEDAPVRRIRTAPAADGTGDRAVLDVEPGYADTLLTQMRTLWDAGEATGTREAEVGGGVVVSFTLRPDGDVALATAVRATADGERLYLARAATGEELRPLVDSFDAVTGEP